VIEGALLILKEQLKGVHLILPEKDSTALVAGARCSSNRFW
jgi:hypothetical protein